MDVVNAFSVMATLVFTFGVLPRLLFPAPKVARGAVDRVLIDVLRMLAFLVAVVHILVPLQLFQWTGLILVGVAWIYFVRVRPAGWTINRFYVWVAQRARAALYVIEAGSKEGNLTVKQAVATWLKTDVAPRLRPRRPSPHTLLVLLLTLPLACVLAASLFLRIAHPMSHAAFAVSDGYVHLAWIKYIFAGELFRDGIYPHGMHAVIGATGKLGPVTAYDLLRFAGPVMNTMIVFVVYVLAVRATRHAGLGLLAAALIGIAGMRPEIGLPDFRQAGTLPQELAVLAGLLGLSQMVEYAVKPQRARLVYLAMSAFVVAMTHPVALGLVAMGAAAGGLVAWARSGRIAAPVRTATAALVGVLAGHVYVPVALLAGRSMYGAVNANPLSSSSGDGTSGAAEPMRVIQGSELRWLAFGGGLVGVLWGIRKLRQAPADRVVATALGVFLTGCVAVYAAGPHLMRFWYLERWADIMRPSLAIGAALALVPLVGLIERMPAAALFDRVAGAEVVRRLVPAMGLGFLSWAPDRTGPRPRPGALVRVGAAVTAGAILVVALAVNLPPVVAHPKYASEYESSARILAETMTRNERFSYTVVGPPSWYDRVLGSGYHVQLTDFADNLSLENAADPSFDLPIATERVYVLAEKVPFRFNHAGDVKGGVERYYNVDSRRELMQNVERWMRTYARSHAGVDVVYEDDLLRLWRVRHPANYAYTKRFGLVREDDMPQPDTVFEQGAN